MIGRTVAHYRITAKLGEGGMGEVYRARDTKLDRDVAIKVLPAALSNSTERMARFEREAKVLAALNHPNIAAIYGLEDRAIVMELVEGPTLAERIRSTVEKTEFQHQGRLIPITVSIGCAVADEDQAADNKQMYALAAAALNHAKKTGRNRYVLYNLRQPPAAAVE